MKGFLIKKKQLNEFIATTSSGAAVNARKKAVERVTTNLFWMDLKENEISSAFGLGNRSHFFEF